MFANYKKGMVIYMTIINSFLQKKKLREFSHGIYMVFAAYVLSILLLVIGSDTLYNIKSKADGVSTQSDEVNQRTIPNEYEDITNSYDTADSMNNSYSVEFRMEYRQKYLQKYQQSNQVTESDDTNWLLGYAMNDEEYDRLMFLMKENEVFLKSEEKAITSFSATGTVTDELSNDKLAIDSSSKSKSSSVIVATKDEIKMLEQIVEAEATGEDIIGKILVANVIFNRMANEEFPDNVKDVIFQKVGDDFQFSPIADKRFWNVKITKETKEAVQRAMDGEDYSEGALYFMARRLARKSSAKWFDNNLKWLFKHGEHEFFK
ncbi:MAG: cell wall hydrolase [Anaerolineaceae bacterium]|nr:MAG: cell wall hydrolase [Anaerolineaceae bacterium]